MEQLSVLRSTAQRLSVTPIEELPRIAGFLAASLASCALLGSEDDQKTVDFSVPLHKIKTRLSSLLQGRSSAERFTATIIIKSYVELVKPVDASQWEAWGRGLVTCMNKQDPWEAKTAYIATLTRMLTLCSQSATLQREVASPLLPAFLNASLAAVKPTTVKISNKDSSLQNKLLPTALRSWCELLEGFSQTFRPFATRMRQVCLMLLECDTTSELLRNAALKTLCMLHLCTPKSTAANDWDQNVANIILATHQTLDIVFRGVVEDWVSTSQSLSQRDKNQDFSKAPKLVNTDSAGLKGWSGLYQGTHRTLVLLMWLEAALSNSSQACNIPLGMLVDLMARITGVTVPSAGTHVKTSSEISKEEREELWANLPPLHSQTMKLVVVVYEVFGQTALPFTSVISNQVLEIFENERWNMNVREASYEAMEAVLRMVHSTGLPTNSPGLLAVIKSCCQDLMKYDSSLDVSSASGWGKNSKQNPVSIRPGPRDQKQRSSQKRGSRIAEAARAMLLAAYEQSSADIAHSLRVEMDRTAILLNDQGLLLASTMNPATGNKATRAQPSLLPFLVRSEAVGSVTLEALLRPRLSNFHAAQGHNAHRFHSEDEVEVIGDEPIVNEKARQNGTNDDHSSSSEVVDSGQTVVDKGKAVHAVAKRKATEAIDGLFAKHADDALVSEIASKRPRQDEWFDETQSAQGDARGRVEAISEPRLASADPTLMSFSEGDAIMIHEPTRPIQDGRIEVPDSDDDSDIPEIDPEPATEDEDG